MYSAAGDTTSLVPGFPIRTSSDPRSVDSSPRHIAASHVLHRLLMPRHPPCALKHLQTQKNNSTKTLQISNFARCSQPLSNKQTPHPTTKMERQRPKVLPQDPIVCRQLCCLKKRRLLLCTKPPPTTGQRLLTAHTPTTGMFFVVLLRKEVIQPHLPVRLPCYDFVPIADPTFDSSPHKG
jgi:hypothetical protein